MIRITSHKRHVHALAADHLHDEVAELILGNRAQPDGRPAEPRHRNGEVGIGTGDADAEPARGTQRRGIERMQEDHGLTEREDMTGWTAHGRDRTGSAAVRL